MQEVICIVLILLAMELMIGKNIKKTHGGWANGYSSQSSTQLNQELEQYKDFTYRTEMERGYLE
jgi:hypothetical protein